MRRMRSAFIAIPFFLAASFGAHADMETVAAFDASVPPGNIAIGPEGRIFMSVHGFFGRAVKLVELLKDGSTTPYPTREWAHAPEGNGNGLYGVLGLNVDENGVLWLLDTSGKDRAGRLIGWDTKTETLRRIIYLAPPAIRPSSFLNDLAIDGKHGFIYIADTARGNEAAVIVVDLGTGRARRVLEGSKFTMPEDMDMAVDGRVVMVGGKPARIGINPITISPDHDWVYFGAMSGTAVYRVKTADLRNAGLDNTALEARVERYGDKPISDGITIDGGGNVYVTSVTDDSIGVVGKDGIYKTLYRRDDMSWPNALAYGPDHYIYVAVNELHRSPALNNGVNTSKGEFSVMRFKALVKGRQGR